jgi:hypothetical protein
MSIVSLMTCSPMVRQLLEGALSNGHRVPFRLKGTSMLPLVRPGETMFLEKANPEFLREGELIVFETSEGFTAHRILRKKRRAGSYWFQPASHEARAPDPWIRDSDVIGHVIEIGKGPAAMTRRKAPSGWSGCLWSWETRIQCYLRKVLRLLSCSASK